MSGEVKKFGNKGYEAISRKMLQDGRLSFREIGLLSHLASHSESWDIYKTSLYDRHPDEKRKAIDKSWKRLVECGYIVQYKRREGQKYSYQYVFNTEPFTIDELEELDDEMSDGDYKLHLSKKMIESFEQSVIEKGKANDLEKWVLIKTDSSVLWELFPENSPKNTVKSTNSEVYSGNSSQRTYIRTINNNNQIDDEEDKKTAFSENQEIKDDLQEMFDQIEKENKQNKKQEPVFSENEWNNPNESFYLYQLFIAYGFPERDAIAISHQIDNSIKRLFVPESIVGQIDWCVHKLETDHIYNLPQYFINGLEQRVSYSNVGHSEFGMETKNRFEQAFEKSNSINDKPVSISNWLENWEE